MSVIAVHLSKVFIAVPENNRRSNNLNIIRIEIIIVIIFQVFVK